MQDLIINGTGNSRFLKSVADVLTLYPTYESFGAALAAGTFPVDFNGINPAGVEQDGTKLNKSTLLTDALCTALGLSPATATPTQAMDKLRTLVSGKASCSFGSYVGNGAESRVVYFPAAIKAVILAAQNGFMAFGSGSNSYYGGIGSPNNSIKINDNLETVHITGTNMTVFSKFDGGSNFIYTNANNETYYYICFY